jgi:hypothetical protein
MISPATDVLAIIFRRRCVLHFQKFSLETIINHSCCQIQPHPRMMQILNPRSRHVRYLVIPVFWKDRLCTEVEGCLWLPRLTATNNEDSRCSVIL